MTRTTPVKKIVQICLSFLFLILVIGYGISRSKDLLFGINLNINDVAGQKSLTDPVIDISGTARRATSVLVNGQTAILSEDGVWRSTVALLPGYNPMTVIAMDKFGKSVTKNLPLYYSAPPQIPDEPSVESVTIPEISVEPLPEVQ
ncbi:MAG: hypothetical protein KBC17_02995 [Candidatus Pacebacteria bacterium]|nr:hypothetical protein [Candidatus Paceibacterota bacterium]